MKEFEVKFRNSQSGGSLIAFVYGTDEQNAKDNLERQGVERHRIISIKVNGEYKGFGHI